MISKKTCDNIDEQGFTFLSIEEKNKLNIVLRVTPATCVALVVIGLYYQSIAIFFSLSIFGILGAATRKGHPVDVLYNFIAGIIGWPKLPPSPAQVRFACGFGALFLIGTTVSLYLDSMIWVYIFGISFIIAAGIMMLTHFCVAAWLYNRFPRRRVN